MSTHHISEVIYTSRGKAFRMAGKSAEERGAHLAVEEGKQVVGLKWNSFKLEGICLVFLVSVFFDASLGMNGGTVYVDTAFSLGSKEKLYQDLGGGMIDGERAANFLMQSGLPMEVLHSIWDLADSGDQGALNREQFFGALRLVAWAQNGHHPEPSLMSMEPIITAGATPAAAPATPATPGAATATTSRATSRGRSLERRVWTEELQRWAVLVRSVSVSLRFQRGSWVVRFERTSTRTAYSRASARALLLAVLQEPFETGEGSRHRAWMEPPEERAVEASRAWRSSEGREIREMRSE
eukprot:g20333.t1